jgi:hypothetical protein
MRANAMVHPDPCSGQILGLMDLARKHRSVMGGCEVHAILASIYMTLTAVKRLLREG